MNRPPAARSVFATPARIVASLLVVIALAGSLALVPAAVASPSAVNEYHLNLPGGSGKASDNSSTDDGGVPIVAIVLGAGAVTVVAVFLLARYRRRDA